MRFAKAARVEWQNETLKICGEMMNQHRPSFCASLGRVERDFNPPICHQCLWLGSGHTGRRGLYTFAGFKAELQAS